MKSWEEDYIFIQQLSRENVKRFGITSLLENKMSGEKVVLKTINQIQELGFQQLQNEASFDFNQTGLPKIISSKIEEGNLSIIKSYADGETLDLFWTRISRRKRLDVLKEITNSLSHLFETLEKEGIVHGDVKPENVVVQKNGGKIQCHLIDFGLAFRKEKLPERKTIFQLAYAPPEIILNLLQCANQGSDVFSFCLVIYKLWSGKLPFTNSNPALMTQLQITYPIERPWLFDKKLWEVLEKGLFKHQFKRSPNRMSKSEIREVLHENNKKRFNDFRSLAQEIEAI